MNISAGLHVYDVVNGSKLDATVPFCATNILYCS
jgi:hypothetical protein